MELVLNPDQGLVCDEDDVSDSVKTLDRGFAPAYYDSATETVYLSRYSDGSKAPVHVLDGIPCNLFPDGNEKSGELPDTIIVGFVRDNRFYTREQAAQSLQDQSDNE